MSAVTAFTTSAMNRPAMKIFRRLYVKRRSASTGLHETTWQNISKYVIKWGSFSHKVDDIRKNVIQQSGVTITLDNKGGHFNDEYNPNSLWYNYLTRHKSLIKIECGYLQGETEDTEPHAISAGVYIVDGEIDTNDETNEATFRTKSLMSIFSDVQSNEINGIIDSTLTASQIIDKIKDHTDGSSNFVFGQFTDRAEWSTETTTNYYYLGDTTTALDGITTFELMQKLSESESAVFYFDRLGNFKFKKRAFQSSGPHFYLYGKGYKNQNIIKVDYYKQPLDKYYNYFRLKFKEDDTVTSYVQAGETVGVNQSSTSWKYGQKLYEMENTYVDGTDAAQSIVNLLYSENYNLYYEIQLKAKYFPSVEVLDDCQLYYSPNRGENTESLWGTIRDKVDPFASENYNIRFNPGRFFVVGMSNNLDDMTTTFTMEYR